MPLEPRVAKIVRLMNALDRRAEGTTMAQRRASSAAIARRGAVLVMPRGPEPAEQRDLLVPVDGGQIVVRLYVPHGARPAPLHVFLHGGGWCVGTLDERDARCRAISASGTSGPRRTSSSIYLPRPSNDIGRYCPSGRPATGIRRISASRRLRAIRC